MWTVAATAVVCLTFARLDHKRHLSSVLPDKHESEPAL